MHEKKLVVENIKLCVEILILKVGIKNVHIEFSNKNVIVENKFLQLK